jgi:hypothetical protein
LGWEGLGQQLGLQQQVEGGFFGVVWSFGSIYEYRMCFSGFLMATGAHFFGKCAKFLHFFLTAGNFAGNIDKIGGMGKVRPCDLRDSCRQWIKERERGAVS